MAKAELLFDNIGGGGNGVVELICMSNSPYQQIMFFLTDGNVRENQGNYPTLAITTHDDDYLTASAIGNTMANGISITMKKSGTLHTYGHGVTDVDTHYNANDTFTLPLGNPVNFTCEIDFD